ncbi:MAG: ubiquinol-cytochrome c reductase iron-sulfur subunit [Patescibacteria group bacterium]
MKNKLQKTGVTRRGFFQWTLIGFGLVASAGAIGAIASQLLKSLMPSGWFSKPYVYRKVYAAPISEIDKAGSSILFQDKANHRKAILINNGGNIQAFSLTCTHLGCQVFWEKEEGKFLCPCHTAIFAADGSVESGPPERPLEQYPVSLENGLVYISFKEPSWQPEQYFKREGL